MIALSTSHQSLEWSKFLTKLYLENHLDRVRTHWDWYLIDSKLLIIIKADKYNNYILEDEPILKCKSSNEIDVKIEDYNNKSQTLLLDNDYTHIKDIVDANVVFNRQHPETIKKIDEYKNKIEELVQDEYEANREKYLIYLI